MREILFRGKTDNGEWLQGFLWVGNDSSYIIPHSLGITYYEKESRIMAFANEVNPETVCQYTSLEDKNGRKIFEGDICKTKFFGKDDGNGHNFSDYDIFKVVFKDGVYLLENNKRQFSAQYIPDMAGDGIEVIGNIFDNPELIGDNNG